jgi:hypothetical protein
MSVRAAPLHVQEPLNVVTLSPRTLGQVLDERRLSLLLDGKGIVLEASKVAQTLFGFDSAALVGFCLVIVLRICPS